MPVRDQYYGGSVEKQWVRIVTVDTRTRRIDAQFKDYGVVQISLYEVPGGFRWPIEGELWMVVRENSEWYLRSPAQSLDTKYPIEDLDQGDTLIGEESAKISMIGTVRARKVIVGSDAITGPDVLTGPEAVTSQGYVGIGGTLEVVGKFIVDSDIWIRDHKLASTDLADTDKLVHGEGFTAGQFAVRTSTGWAPATQANFETAHTAPYETVITGTGSQTSFTINHNLGTRNVVVTIRENFNPYEHVAAKVKSVTINTITIETLPALTNGFDYSVLVARALGGAATPPAVGAPLAHSASHEWNASDKLFVGPAVAAFKTAQSLPSGSVDNVLFNAEEYKKGIIHDNAVNPHLFTIPSGGTGWYSGMFSVIYGGAQGTGVRYMDVVRNGVMWVANRSAPSDGGERLLSFAGPFAAGETLFFRFYQSQGVTVTADARVNFASQGAI